MAPLVLLGTVLTHLFGGSAGREGTAVQMGASLAEWLAELFTEHQMRRAVLMAGIAGGFGGVAQFRRGGDEARPCCRPCAA